MAGTCGNVEDLPSLETITSEGSLCVNVEDLFSISNFCR